MATSNSLEPTRDVGSLEARRATETSLTHPGEFARRIPVIEEVLQIDKQIVDRCGIRVTKRVETREELVDELLRSEHVEVERRPINSAIAGDLPPGHPLRR